MLKEGDKLRRTNMGIRRRNLYRINIRGLCRKACSYIVLNKLNIKIRSRLTHNLLTS